MTGYKDVLDDLRSISDTAALVAVSKTHPYSAVLEAYDEGARIFGENRVQEAEGKFPKPEERPEGMKLYLIGQLQRNKAKKAVAFFDRIESVDSMALIEKIEKEAALIDKRIEILLEVNSSGEEQKSGFRTREETLEAAAFIRSSCPHIVLKGIMTVGPLGFDREKNAKAFSYAESVFNEISSEDADVLSMGMSGDWREAIEAGSTEIRIGTAIFGART